MCITFFHLNSDSGSPYKLIIVMNRDEYTGRPTAQSSWQDGLLAGWDQQPGREGGTWLAADRKGRVGLLTNIFTGGVLQENAAGRGFLITEWLRSNQSAESYLKNLSQDNKLYNPFNLILFEQDDHGQYCVWRYTRGKKGHTESFGPQQETSGTFGVGNHPQHQPYRKSVWGKEQLEEMVGKWKEDNTKVSDTLENLMLDKRLHWPDHQIIAQSKNEDGPPGPFAKNGEKLSSVFVEIDSEYQTRTTTTILVSQDDHVFFRENNWTGAKISSVEEYIIQSDL